jgi:mannose-6-phosphate isomerase-like protein (cupin superfamily)
VEVGRDDRTSHHVVAIRDREQPHRHERHDLFVVILRGHGTMLLGDQERPVGQNSILYVPRGTTHAFHNTSGEPAIAYAVYAPAFDGRDRTPVRID